jgi:hypothetical protein
LKRFVIDAATLPKWQAKLIKNLTKGKNVNPAGGERRNPQKQFMSLL